MPTHHVPAASTQRHLFTERLTTLPATILPRRSFCVFDDPFDPAAPSELWGPPVFPSFNDYRIMKEEHDKLELMKTVAKRPGMYGLHRLSDFFHFMNGCSTVWRTLEIEDLFDNDFRGWVSKKFRRPPNLAWDYFILEAWGDDEEGIQKFVELYDEFRNSRVA